MDKSYKKYNWMPDIPDKWRNESVTFDEKHKWYPVRNTERYESRVQIPCTECDRIFFGSRDGVIELKLHLILQHMRVITHG